ATGIGFDAVLARPPASVTADLTPAGLSEAQKVVLRDYTPDHYREGDPDTTFRAVAQRAGIGHGLTNEQFRKSYGALFQAKARQLKKPGLWTQTDIGNVLETTEQSISARVTATIATGFDVVLARPPVAAAPAGPRAKSESGDSAVADDFTENESAD